jgi:hypothetical protein
MANYYAEFRSNYFRVQDVEAFRAWCEKWNVKFIPEALPDEPNPLVGFVNSGFYEAGIPSEYYDDEKDEYDEDSNFIMELSEHLQDNEVAIVMEVGNEKLRYLIGYAMAVNAAGELLGVGLNDIYGLVKKEWGVDATEASY